MEMLESIMVMLSELEQDTQTPRHVKAKLSSTMKVLNSADEHSIKVSKALCELEDITDDSKVDSQIRMQIFNVVSMLEARKF